MNFAVLITAAGFSKRFRNAGSGNKLLALLHGKPVLRHTLEHAQATGMDVYVITRPEDHQIHAMANQANLIKFASDGLGLSIAAGVKATKNYDGWIIAHGDMPLLTTASYMAVKRQLLTSPLVRCVVDGKFGHPAGFQKKFLEELIALDGDISARRIFGSHPSVSVNLDDPGCLLDVDTQSELRILSNYLNDIKL